MKSMRSSVTDASYFQISNRKPKFNEVRNIRHLYLHYFFVGVSIYVIKINA